MAASSSSLGLLAGYSSASDSEEECEVTGEAVRSRGDRTGQKRGKRAAESGSTTGASINFLLDTNISSDEDSDSGEAGLKTLKSEKCHTASSQQVDYLAQTKLPAPKLDAPPLGGEKTTTKNSSIFNNPFKEEQLEKLVVLQKHVQLTVHDKPLEIGGRKICHLYRKNGRCRFGINCKFAHDSDLQVTETPERCQAQNSTPMLSPSALAIAHSEAGVEEEQVNKGKRKPGLSQTLIPPKRALKNFQAQVAKERPWVL